MRSPRTTAPTTPGPADRSGDASQDPTDITELEELRARCAFYRQLLDLAETETIEAVATSALRLAMKAAEAQSAYLELYRDDGKLVFAKAQVLDGGAPGAFERTISRSVLRAALEKGETICSASAMADPRFAHRGSVKRHRIEAVVCAPIGDRAPFGALYLQGRDQRGPFPEPSRRAVEDLAKHLAPFLLRFVVERRVDPTAKFRVRLRARAIVGRSAALAAVLEQAAIVAPQSVSLLLTGPAGTGKTQLARVIHESGPRAGAAFIEVSCPALADARFERALFGTVAATEGAAPAAGKLAQAHRGTLFLDEISALSLAAQSKLLQFIRSGLYDPQGASLPRTSDVRIIAATKVDLERAVADGRFRGDLLHWLHAVPIRLPALAERSTDLRLLAQHFLRGHGAAVGEQPLHLSEAALAVLEAQPWPGNVRELGQVLEAGTRRAVADGTAHVEPHHLFPATRVPSATTPCDAAPPSRTDREP